MSSMAVLLLSGLLGSAFFQGTAQSQDSGAWNRLSERLATKTVDAHLHEALAEKYGVVVRPGDLWNGHAAFTRKTYPVRMDRSEEWAPALGGVNYLLHDSMYVPLLALFEEARSQPVRHLGLVERAHLQGELWTIFDLLVQEGSHPVRRSSLAADRWKRLLEECARAMRALGFTKAEVQALPDGAEARHALFLQSGMTTGAPTEFYSMQFMPLHDIAHAYRRVTRFFYWDPRRDFSRLSKEELTLLQNRSLPFSEGAVAVLEEDAVVLSDLGQLVPTTIPLFFKTYRVSAPSEKASAMEFRMYHVDRTSEAVNGSALRPLPRDTEAWAQVELPNMAGYKDNPAMRAPMTQVCKGCHSTIPNAFSPALFDPDPRLYCCTQEGNRFSTERAIRIKFGSFEYELLKEYFDGLVPEAAAKAPPAPERRRLSSGVETGIAVVVALLAMGLVRFVRRKPAAAPVRPGGER